MKTKVFLGNGTLQSDTVTSFALVSQSVRAYQLAYDGQPYHGFQRQPDVPTVEDTLFDALSALDVLTDETTPPGYAGAGRTDSGVSALVQTISFEAPDWLTPSAFNSELPGSIRVWASAEVPEEFHATHWASEREYTYFLWAGDAEETLARQTLEALSGEHDFHNLTPDDTGTVRTLDAVLEPEPPFFVIRVRAGGFPRQFVRRAVTLVSDIARGTRPLSFVDRVLSPETLSGPDGIGPAPAPPLVLTGVSYPNIRFIVDQEAARRSREQFGAMYRERATNARLAEVLASSLGEFFDPAV